MTGRTTKLLAISGLALMILFLSYGSSQPGVLSRWTPIAKAVGVISSQAKTLPMISGNASVLAETQQGWAAFESHSASSELLDSHADGQLRLYRRQLGQGTLIYVFVELGNHVFLETIHADGATPGSDARGDTIWVDGKQHLQPVSVMVAAPYAQRPGSQLIAALAFGFHGDVRTSNEGTVVSDGKILRANPGRATLCITPRGEANIGLFDVEALKNCQQAFGAGPILMHNRKIVQPGLKEETEGYLPFNPLNEDFTQIEWRKKVYAGNYPKTIIGLGHYEDGRSYLVLLTSYNISGPDVLHELRAMGCTEALGGDDDSSTQLVWQGSMTVERPVRAVPDAVGVYVSSQ